MNDTSQNQRSKTIESPLFVSYKSDLLTVIAARPIPPGSRVRLDLFFDDHSEPLLLEGKIVSIFGRKAGEFEITVRLHSLTRDKRTALELASNLRRGVDEIKF